MYIDKIYNRLYSDNNQQGIEVLMNEIRVFAMSAYDKTAIDAKIRLANAGKLKGSGSFKKSDSRGGGTVEASRPLNDLINSMVSRQDEDPDYAKKIHQLIEDKYDKTPDAWSKLRNTLKMVPKIGLDKTDRELVDNLDKRKDTIMKKWDLHDVSGKKKPEFDTEDLIDYNKADLKKVKGIRAKYKELQKAKKDKATTTNKPTQSTQNNKPNNPSPKPNQTQTKKKS